MDCAFTIIVNLERPETYINCPYLVSIHHTCKAHVDVIHLVNNLNLYNYIQPLFDMQRSMPDIFTNRAANIHNFYIQFADLMQLCLLLVCPNASTKITSSSFITLYLDDEHTWASAYMVGIKVLLYDLLTCKENGAHINKDVLTCERVLSPSKQSLVPWTNLYKNGCFHVSYLQYKIITQLRYKHSCYYLTTTLRNLLNTAKSYEETTGNAISDSIKPAAASSHAIHPRANSNSSNSASTLSQCAIFMASTPEEIYDLTRQLAPLSLMRPLHKFKKAAEKIMSLTKAALFHMKYNI